MCDLADEQTAIVSNTHINGRYSRDFLCHQQSSGAEWKQGHGFRFADEYRANEARILRPSEFPSSHGFHTFFPISRVSRPSDI